MLSLRARLAALLLGLVPSALLAVNVSEPPDFPNNTPGPATTLTLGANTFSGTINTANDFRDRFDVTVPAGLRMASASKTFAANGNPQNAQCTFNGQLLSGTGAGNYSTGFPLPAGTYSAVINADFATGNAWTMTFTLEPMPDYTVTNTGGLLVLTDNLGVGEAITLSQPSAGTIRFAIPVARSFSVNVAPATTVSFVDVSLPGLTSIVVNAGAGDDTIAVGSFTDSFPSLTINGGTGDDTVHFGGDIGFGSFSHLSVDLQDDSTTPGRDAVTVEPGTHLSLQFGNITMRCSRNVTVGAGATVETSHGDIVLEANYQVTPTSGDFIGVNLRGPGTVVQSGNGNVTVKGRGGDDPGGLQLGVAVVDGARIIGTEYIYQVTVMGIGGAGVGSANRGVTVAGEGSAITAPGSRVVVTGYGGANGSHSGSGVSVRDGGEISARSRVTVEGVGRGAPGSGSNPGVEIRGDGSRVTTRFENLQITGTAGPGSLSGADGSWGVLLADSGLIAVEETGGQFDFRQAQISTDSLSIDATSSVAIDLTGASFAIEKRSGTADFLVGGADAPGVLGLSVAELDRIATESLVLRSYGTGKMILAAPITQSAGALTLMTEFGNGGIRADAAGTDVSAGTRLLLRGTLAMPCTGPAPDIGYPQLKAAGLVEILYPSTLDLAGTTFAGEFGDTFTIIDNDGTDAISGSFLNLSEGATLPWPAASELRACISYVGGTGNDVTLKLVGSQEVTNTADSGPGSLRDALAAAAANPGADVISFRPTLDGQTIVLGSELVVGDASGAVSINASDLPVGIGIYGSAGGTRLFSVASGTTLHLKKLALTRGNGAGAIESGCGGAIYNTGTLTLTDCTVRDNTSTDRGGAIDARGSGASVSAFRCLFTSNDSGGISGGGGAIFARSLAEVFATDCTFLGNTSATGGGAVHLFAGSLGSFTRCTFSGNSGIDGGAVLASSGNLSLIQCTLSGNNAMGDGGGVLASGSPVTLRHCTVAGNSADDSGGIQHDGGNLIVDNTIIAGNTATQTSVTDLNLASGSLTRIGHNIIGNNASVSAHFPAGAPNGNGDFVGTLANPVAVLFAPLDDYGGLTHTMALLPGSPARNNSSASAVTSDQRGFPIVGTADIGAYEAGTIRNYTHWSWETLPASATVGDRAASFDFDGDARNNALEFATLTDGGQPSASVLLSPALNPDRTQATLTIPCRSSIAGLRYFIDRSTTLLAWTPIAAVDSGRNTVTFLAPGVSLISVDAVSRTFTDATIADQTRVFHRLRIELGP